MEEGGRMFEVSEGDRARQDKRIQERSYLDPVIKTRFKSKLADINKWSGLPAMTEQQLEEAASGARHENYVSVDADWERLMGAQLRRDTVRPPAGRREITPAEEIRAEKVQALKQYQADTKDDKGHQGNVAPVFTVITAGDQLASRNPKRYAATMESLADLRTFRAAAEKAGKNGDAALVALAKKRLSDPKYQEKLNADPFARELLTTIAAAEQDVAGKPATGVLGTGFMGESAVPPRPLPR